MMKRHIQLSGALRGLLLALCAAMLIVPSFAQTAFLSRNELSVSLQDETVTVEDFGAAGDGVTDDSAAIEAALNSGAAKVEFGAGKTYLYKERIIMTASNVEIEGNGATLEWDGDTTFETWEELHIFGKTPESPVTNIYLHDLNFLSPNAGSVRRSNSIQLLLYNCSDVRVDDCGFLITEGRGNEMYSDGGKGVSNIWIYGDCHRIDITNCSLKNLSHASGIPVDGEVYNGAGGNVWISGYTEAGTQNTHISDITIQNNRIEKSCHDESIAIWSAEADRILIDGNEFHTHEKGEVLDYSDMVFTIGNIRGCAEGKADVVRDVRFTNNQIYAESRHSLFSCGGQAGSEAVEISGNDITWVKLDSTANYCGIVDTEACQCVVVLKDNHIRYEDSDEGGYFYKFFGSRKLEVDGNVIEVKGVLAHLCDLDDDAQSAMDTTRIYNNRFVIDSELNYLSMGYDFHDNIVVFNVPVKNSIFPYYQRDLIRAPRISGNYIQINGLYEEAGTGRDVLFMMGCKMNGYEVDFTDNVIDSTVAQESGDAFNLIHLLTDPEEEEQRVNALHTRSNLFSLIDYYQNTVNPVVLTDDMEVRSWTELPLCTARCTAELTENGFDGYALTYTLTAPKPEETSLYLACYDEEGAMLALKILPDAPLTGRETITLPDFFTPSDLSDMRCCQLYLLEDNTLCPVCEHWAGDLPA